MIPLGSPRWAELTQAYGSAEDVPRLLAALADVDDDEARAEIWFALSRMLYRSDAAFSAAYAAAPHMLSIVEGQALSERIQALELVTRIEIARRGPESAPMPADLLAAYAEAIDGLPRLVTEAGTEAWSEAVAQVCAAALLVGKRQPALARAVLAIGAPADTSPAGFTY
jgi:hypothetical protein